MADGLHAHGDEREEITVAVVGPEPRLLFWLVLLLVGALLVFLFLTSGDRSGDRITLGSIEDLSDQAEAGPVRLSELPHLVLTKTTLASPMYDARIGQAAGALLLSPTEQLVVLETRDPEDGAELTWCRAADAFAHPTGARWYAADGTLLAGNGRRGMDRRALSVIGGGSVEVDDRRWIGGVPLQSSDTAWTPRGSCLD